MSIALQFQVGFSLKMELHTNVILLLNCNPSVYSKVQMSPVFCQTSPVKDNDYYSVKTVLHVLVICKSWFFTVRLWLDHCNPWRKSSTKCPELRLSAHLQYVTSILHHYVPVHFRANNFCREFTCVVQLVKLCWCWYDLFCAMCIIN